MRFSELHATIPYVTEGKQKSLTYSPYPNIELAMPGRHAKDTSPPGGDFVVRVSDTNLGWTKHEFTHTDIFKVLEEKKKAQINPSQFLMEDYLKVVNEDMEVTFDTVKNLTVTLTGEWMQTMNDMTFLQAVQCLAVAEHRRYAKFEKRGGGKFLPFRFGAGIVEGRWSAADAAGMQRKGRPGVEILEKLYGIPQLTQDLMKGIQ